MTWIKFNHKVPQYSYDKKSVFVNENWEGPKIQQTHVKILFDLFIFFHRKYKSKSIWCLSSINIKKIRDIFDFPSPVRDGKMKIGEI